MQGLHLTADCTGCDPDSPPMRQPDALRTLCLQAVAAAGLTAVGELFHRFVPTASSTHEPGPSTGGNGITGVVLLAESHLAIHTWPEIGAVTLDVYVCNFGADNTARAEALLQALLDGLQPVVVDRQRLERGRRRPSS
jgi:S-adenosylmethionine decarboxylase